VVQEWFIAINETDRSLAEKLFEKADPCLVLKQLG
jgi:hypothetical protein